jgi:putative membrane protein
MTSKTMRIWSLRNLGVLTIAAWVASPAAIAGNTRQETRRLLNDIHRSNQKDMRMGLLAQEKGTTLQVRGLGETLVRDLRNADKAITFVAQRAGVKLNAADPTGYSEVRRLQYLSGQAFDHAFLRTLISDHQKHRQKLLSAKDALPQKDVKELVQSFVPTLDKHLEWARHIRSL